MKGCETIIKKLNEEILGEFVDMLKGYGYHQQESIRNDAEFKDDAFVSLDSRSGECPPITVAIVTDENDNRGLIIKTTVVIYPFTDKSQLLEMVNGLNNYFGHTKCTIEEDGDNYYFALSQVHILDDSPELKLHKAALHDMKAWKQTIRHLIENHYISTDDEVTNIYCD